jgi:hypothetical protein
VTPANNGDSQYIAGRGVGAAAGGTGGQGLVIINY